MRNSIGIHSLGSLAVLSTGILTYLCYFNELRILSAVSSDMGIHPWIFFPLLGVSYLFLIGSSVVYVFYLLLQMFQALKRKT
jgi:hypothetical protein